MATTSDRTIRQPEKAYPEAFDQEIPLASNETLYKGTLVGVKGGNAYSADQSGQPYDFIGFTQRHYGSDDNTPRVVSHRVVNLNTNSDFSGAEGQAAYLTDNDTVQLTNADGAQFVGIVQEVIDSSTAFIYVPGQLGVQDIGGSLVLETSHDFSSIASGAEATHDVTVTGAADGDFVRIEVDDALENGLTIQAYVSGADTVTIELYNTTSGAVDPANHTFRIEVIKR